MSHVPQRKEKDCLNCGTIVQGRYCQVCGQENVVPKETFWHMFTHFFSDITHFDGKFFTSVKDLLFKPGFLSKEYMLGRRVRYLHPVRMYVFTSAIFFLLFFTFFKPATSDNGEEIVSPQERASFINELKDSLTLRPHDKLLLSNLADAEDSSRTLTRDEVNRVKRRGFTVQISKGTYQSVAEYDSAQSVMPADERDGWFTRLMQKKQIQINLKYRDKPGAAQEKLIENVLHRLPYFLFVSLPLFALILKFVYIRRRQFYYADHGVFTIHIYIFTFLIMLFLFTLDKINDRWPTDYIWIPNTILVLGLGFYLYKAMRYFYGQRRAKTFWKSVIISISAFIMLIALIVLFFFISVLTL